MPGQRTSHRRARNWLSATPCAQSTFASPHRPLRAARAGRRRAAPPCGSARPRGPATPPRCAFRSIARGACSYSARAASRFFTMLAHRLAQSVEEGAVVLQLHRVHGAAGDGRIAHVLVAVALELLELPLQVRHLARGVRHRAAQRVGGIRGDLLNRLESFGFRHGAAHYLPGCRLRRRELRHELLQIGVTALDSDRLIHVLAQEFLDFRPLLDRQVDPRVGAAPIGARR